MTMDNLERSNKNSAPLVHLYPMIDEIGSTDVLLIVKPSGEKYQLSLDRLKKEIDGMVEEAVKHVDYKVDVTMDDVINAFKTKSTVHFFKPINVFNDKIVEKNTKDIGKFYCDGTRLRICTEDGWKSVLLTD